MKRLFKWFTLAALAASLSSCGLPGALVRTSRSLSRTPQTTADAINTFANSLTNKVDDSDISVDSTFSGSVSN
jgi:hypothetical protein